MLYDPIISRKIADDLNSIAANIDPALFWVCNYEPVPTPVFSSDAFFLRSIQDLYNFAIDSNCVLKPIVFGMPNAISRQLLSDTDIQKAKYAINVINMLRAIHDHNHSGLNGALDIEKVGEYQDWVFSVIAKREPESLEDFDKLNLELKEIGSILIRISNNAMVAVAQHSNTSEIVQKWKRQTINWYCETVHREHYYSQLADYYLAKRQMLFPVSADSLSQRQLRKRVCKWILKMIEEEPQGRNNELDCQIADCNAGLRDLDKIVHDLSQERASILYADGSNKADGAETAEGCWSEVVSGRIIEIDEELLVCSETKRNLEAEIDELGLLKEGNMLELKRRLRGIQAAKKIEHSKELGYFFDVMLPDQLENLMCYMEEEGELNYLLPQHLLRFQIESVFCYVTLPNGRSNNR